VGRSIDSLLAMTADASPYGAGSDEGAGSARDDDASDSDSELAAVVAAQEATEPSPAGTQPAPGGESGAGSGGAQAAAALAAAAPLPAPAEEAEAAGAAVLVRPPGHVHRELSASAREAAPLPPSGGPVAMLAPRGGAAAAHAAAAAAAAAADIRRASNAAAGGSRTPGAAPPSPQRFAPAGAESNLFAWVASLLAPNDASAAFGAAARMSMSGTWEGARGSMGGAIDAAFYDGGVGGGGDSGGRGGGGEEGGDSDLWVWQRGVGGADAGEEEAALAAGARLWDATAVRVHAPRALRACARVRRAECALTRASAAVVMPAHPPCAHASPAGHGHRCWLPLRACLRAALALRAGHAGGAGGAHTRTHA
jgi:hypothetical protein